MSKKADAALRAIGSPHVCETCGKTFYCLRPGVWTYKKKSRHVKWFCGYNCMRAFEEATKKVVVSDGRT